MQYSSLQFTVKLLQFRSIWKRSVNLTLFFSSSPLFPPPLPQLGTGYLIKGVGFFVPALIAACCLVFAFLITIFLLPETIRDRRNFTWNIGTHIKNVSIYELWTCPVISVPLLFFFLQYYRQVQWEKSNIQTRILIDMMNKAIDGIIV